MDKEAIQVERVEDKGIQPPSSALCWCWNSNGPYYTSIALLPTTTMDDIIHCANGHYYYYYNNNVSPSCIWLCHIGSYSISSFLEKFHPHRWVPIQCINKMMDHPYSHGPLQVSCVCYVYLVVAFVDNRISIPIITPHEKANAVQDFLIQYLLLFLYHPSSRGASSQCRTMAVQTPYKDSWSL